MADQEGYLTEKHCDTVKEFLEHVSPRSPLFPKGILFGGPRDWLYRGHADAAWQLLPLALRESSKEVLNFFPGEETTEGQITTEWNALASFYEASDEAGLPIPEDSQQVSGGKNRNR